MPEIVAPDLPVITEQQFALWKHNPVTQVVREFLKAYKRQLERDHLDRWMAGTDDPKFENRALGVALFVDEFLQLEYAALAMAYGVADAGQDDGRATKAAAGQPS